MATLRGQNLRILDGSTVYAKAVNCTITLNSNTADTSTKDDPGMSTKQDVVSKSWQIQVEALETMDVASLLTAMKSGYPLTVIYDETQTPGNTNPINATFGRSGQAILSDATFTFNDREYAAKNLTFSGTGPLNKFSTT